MPHDYHSLLTPRETQQAIFRIKRYIEDNLCKELHLMMVEVPLIVDVESGVNDMLDRDGSRTPIQFHIPNDRDKHPVDAQVVQAATKWKRVALKQFDCKVGEGLCTDMRAVRKDYFLDHDHSAYVDQCGLGAGDQRRAAQPRFPEGRGSQDLESDRRGRAVRTGDVPLSSKTRVIRAFPRNSSSCRRRNFSICIRTCPGSSARRRFFRNVPPSSSSVSADH